MSEYKDTVGTLSRASVTAPQTVRIYADLGLLDHIVLPNGMRLFREGQADRVKEIKKQRMALRGRRAG